MSKIYMDLETNIDPKIISDKLLSYVKNNTDILSKKTFWHTLNTNDVIAYIPEINYVFSKLNLDVHNISIIYTDNEWRHGLLHCDWNPQRTNGFCDSRVLWPVYNCDKSRSEFYEVKKDKLRYENNPPFGHCLAFDKEDIIKTLHSFTLTKPIIFDPNSPHSIWIEEDIDYRLTATFGFRNPPNHLLEMEDSSK